MVSPWNEFFDYYETWCEYLSCNFSKYMYSSNSIIKSKMSQCDQSNIDRMDFFYDLWIQYILRADILQPFETSI